MTRTAAPFSLASVTDVLEKTIRDAARSIRSGALVAFPTETVYGLGADATSSDAVSRVFAAKGRPQFNPLIAHVATIEMAQREGLFTPEAETLADTFWPGPLTLVLARRPGGSVCDLACAGLATVGLRIPNHPIALALLEATALPVAAPSANPSGRLSPTKAIDVEASLGGHVTTILDGGPCAIGVESTIIACVGDHIAVLRPGGLSRQEIEARLGRSLDVAGHGIRAPGMMESHYAPHAVLRLDATIIEPDEAGLDFWGRLGADLDLSPSGNLREAAANLYDFLRRLDARAERIAVAPIPDDGLGAAINDRLRRAAAPRPTQPI